MTDADFPTESEIHIAGVLVQTQPARRATVAATIAALPQLEVRSVDDSGKLIVISECESADATLALIARMRDLPGVMNVALVYQHAESAATMEQEISDENDPSRIH